MRDPAQRPPALPSAVAPTAARSACALLRSARNHAHERVLVSPTLNFITFTCSMQTCGLGAFGYRPCALRRSGGLLRTRPRPNVGSPRGGQTDVRAPPLRSARRRTAYFATSADFCSPHALLPPPLCTAMFTPPLRTAGNCTSDLRVAHAQASAIFHIPDVRRLGRYWSTDVRTVQTRRRKPAQGLEPGSMASHASFLTTEIPAN